MTLNAPLRPDVRKWDGPAVLLLCRRWKLARGAEDKEHAMFEKGE
jgi:hypothetical protein